MEHTSLIERIKGNEGEQCLEEIYRDYRNEFILWAVRHHSCGMEEAKDVFQQSVIIFYENIRFGKVTEITTKVKTYLFSIGKNKMLELMRQRNKHQPGFNDQVVQEHDYLYNEYDEDYEAKLRNVEASLTKLGDPCKSILMQYYYDRKSMVEIAETMEYKNSDTVKNLKYKCIQRLKQIFKTDFGVLIEQ